MDLADVVITAEDLVAGFELYLLNGALLLGEVDVGVGDDAVDVVDGAVAVDVVANVLLVEALELKPVLEVVGAEDVDRVASRVSLLVRVMLVM